MKKFIFKTAAFATLALTLTACRHDDNTVDDLPQEEMSNILLSIKDDATGSVQVADYQVNGSAYPTIKLVDGHTYTVTASFKNGAEDVTSEIRQAKDEHFLTYDFPNSDIALKRIDDASSTRADGVRVGLSTKWVVTKAAPNGNATVILTLYHESKTVSESSAASGAGRVFGVQTGGETDSKATYKISY